MSGAFHLSLGLLVFPILVLILGVFLVWHGRRRVGVAPHCGKCDYLLVGNESAVCPECGQGLAEGNIVLGERVRTRRLRLGWAMIVLGLLGAAGVCTPAVWQYDWYRIRPLSWVIQDAGLRDAAGAKRAWGELERRRSVGRLAEGDEKQVVELGLGEQAAVQEGRAPSPILAEILKMLGERAVDGKLTDSQMKRLMENAIRFRVRVRSVVAAGKPCSVEWSATTCAPLAAFWVETAGSLNIDDRKMPGGGMESTQGFEFGTETHAFISPAKGDYPVIVTEHVRVFGSKDDKKGKLLHDWKAQAIATLHVRDAAPADDLMLIDRPELLAAMKAAVSVKGWKAEAEGFSVFLRINSPPENVAFEILARASGREYPLGSVTLEKGKQMGFYLSSEIIKEGYMDRGPLDIVLRSSEGIARQTVYLHEIWKGEVVVKSVPYLPRGAAD